MVLPFLNMPPATHTHTLPCRHKNISNKAWETGRPGGDAHKYSLKHRVGVAWHSVLKYHCYVSEPSIFTVRLYIISRPREDSEQFENNNVHFMI